MTGDNPLHQPREAVTSLLSNHRVLTCVAVPVEHGPVLAERLPAVHIGVGPVEAAVACTLALSTLERRDELPDLVLSLGSAGSKHLAQSSVHQISRVSWRDMDATALGIAPGCTPFLDLPADVELAAGIPGIPEASLSTGANIITGEAWDSITTDLVDMETFAVMRACHSFGVPLVGLRGVSDGAEELRQYADWADCLPSIQQGLADAVDRLVNALASGWVPRRHGSN